MSSNVTWDGSKDLKIYASLKYDKILERNAKRCLNHLMAISPEAANRRADKYKYGWRMTADKKSGNESFIEIWNETNWQLTHLLENGHIIANKKGGVGWASARPHIQNAIDFVAPQFISEMENAELDIDIK